MTLKEKVKKYKIQTTKIVKQDITSFRSSIKDFIEDLNLFLQKNNASDGRIDIEYSYGDNSEIYAIVEVNKTDEELQSEVDATEKRMLAEKNHRYAAYLNLKKEFYSEE